MISASSEAIERAERVAADLGSRAGMGELVAYLRELSRSTSELDDVRAELDEMDEELNP